MSETKKADQENPSIFSGSVENAATPFRRRLRRKYARTAKNNACLKMSVAIPPNVVDPDILIQGFN